MEELKAHKVVSALPGTLEANSVYYVRSGSGFDIYVTNDTGTLIAYQLNCNLTKVTGPVSATDGHVVQFDGTSGKLVKGGYTISYLLDVANFTGTLPAARLPAHTGDVTSSAGSAALTLATVNPNVGSYGSATQVATFTVNGKGLTTAAGNVTITPAWSSVTGKPTTISGYGITDLLASIIAIDGAASGIDSDLLDGQHGSYYLDLTNATGTIAAARLPAFTGDATTVAGASAITLATVNSNTGTFGSATQVAQVTVNGKGLVTAASAVTITPSWSNVQSKPTTLSGYSIAASDVRDTLLTVDGAGTGLDADLLDGQHGSYYQNATNLNAGTISDARLPTTLAGKTFTTSTVLTGGSSLIVYEATSPRLNSIRLFADSTGGTLQSTYSTGGTFALNFQLGSTIYGSITTSATTFNNNLTTTGNLTSSSLMTSTGKVSSYGGAGTYRGFTINSGNGGSSQRWWLYADNAAESGSNAGSNLFLSAYTDSGLHLGRVFSVNRATQVLDFAITPTVNGASLVTSANDGAGSGFDADLLDGQHGSYYRDASNLNAGTVAAARLPALTGDITTTAGSAATTLATVNSNVGSFGSATAVPVITANAKGLVTSISTVTITPAFSSITSKPTTLSGYGITDAVSSTATGLGLTGNQLSDAVTDTAAEWSALPIGYSKMMNVSIGTVGGLPLANYGYFTKIANRDTDGGWSGLWVGYGAGQNYFGRSGDSSTLPVWEKIWTEANDGTGSNLDADLLDGMNSATAATVSTIVARDSAGDITTVDLNTTAGSGNGIKFWGGNDAYSIYLSINSDATYGGRVSGESTSDCNMYFRMQDGTNRGWVFRNATTALAGIDGAGNIRAIGAITGSNLSGTNTGDQTNITGNAGTATTLQTGRTIGITGDATWTSPTFNGSSNVTAALTLASVNSNIGSYGSATQVATFTVNAKGLITAAGAVTITPAWGSITGKPTTLSGYGITDAVKTVNGASPDGSGNVTIQEVVSSAASYSYNSDGTLSGYTETISGNSKVTTLTYSSGQLSTKAVTYLGVTKTTTYTYNADGTIASTATV